MPTEILEVNPDSLKILREQENPNILNGIKPNNNPAESGSDKEKLERAGDLEREEIIKANEWLLKRLHDYEISQEHIDKICTSFIKLTLERKNKNEPVEELAKSYLDSLMLNNKDTDEATVSAAQWLFGELSSRGVIKELRDGLCKSFHVFSLVKHNISEPERAEKFLSDFVKNYPKYKKPGEEF